MELGYFTLSLKSNVVVLCSCFKYPHSGETKSSESISRQHMPKTRLVGQFLEE